MLICSPVDWLKMSLIRTRRAESLLHESEQCNNEIIADGSTLAFTSIYIDECKWVEWETLVLCLWFSESQTDLLQVRIIKKKTSSSCFVLSLRHSKSHIRSFTWSPLCLLTLHFSDLWAHTGPTVTALSLSSVLILSTGHSSTVRTDRPDTRDLAVSEQRSAQCSHEQKMGQINKCPLGRALTHTQHSGSWVL